MPTRASRRCTRCGAKTPTSPCATCDARRRKTVDRRRGTAVERGYGAGHQDFRKAVLQRDPWCQCPGCTVCHHAAPGSPCVRSSKHADHHPQTRRELVALGLNPDDPQHGRGLCHRCHSHWTVTLDGGFGRPTG